MVRWKDSIPVLAKEGGFFVLDSRTHTNDISNSDKLTVVCTNGNGNYELYEDGENGCVVTKFLSEGNDCSQKLTISIVGDNNVIPNRTISFEMRNIRNGKVMVTGTDNYEIDENGCTIVSIKNVKCGDSFTIDIEYHNDIKSYRNERLLYSLQRIEGSYDKKNLIWNKALTLSDDQLKEYINGLDHLTKRQKMRLLEAW